MPQDDFAESVGQLLYDAGLDPEREPSWVDDGPVPDFFCRGDPPIWVEAKQLERSSDWICVRRLWDYLREHANDVPCPGEAHSYISPGADQGDAKRALELVRREFGRSPVDRCLAVIHGQDRPLDLVELSYTANGEVVRYISDQPPSGKLGIPYGVPPDDWSERAAVQASNRTNQSEPLFRIIAEDAFLIALDMRPSEKPFHIAMATHGGGARESTVKRRLRKRLRTANSQFKNAQNVVDGPALAIVGDTGEIPDTLEQDDVIEALFGDLTVSFPIGDEGSTEAFYGKNGIWHSEQHTSTSAVCWIENGEPMLTVHNPWARRRLQMGLLGGREVEVGNDGRLHDCSDKDV